LYVLFVNACVAANTAKVSVTSGSVTAAAMLPTAAVIVAHPDPPALHKPNEPVNVLACPNVTACRQPATELLVAFNTVPAAAVPPEIVAPDIDMLAPKVCNADHVFAALSEGAPIVLELIVTAAEQLNVAPEAAPLPVLLNVILLAHPPPPDPVVFRFPELSTNR
jgi:hypothetical protein